MIRGLLFGSDYSNVCLRYVAVKHMREKAIKGLTVKCVNWRKNTEDIIAFKIMETIFC